MLKPLNGRVVIQIEEVEEKTVSGIVLPSAAKEKPQIGKVLAVSDDTEEFKSQLSVGDRVLFEKYAGSEVEYQGESYLIIKESDIVAVVD
ncbi:co-chaperone GroES [Aerococcus kribbianus]|uniref:Co-chaperonin GroES n=1 Tax=Aerococcus kribbianus TaxID=2999064 RepID=A0A9X3JDI1_9LACT|nr:MULTISPECIES: co-chaperone GroES [unclassified Aerococcus]MCZ0717515.1 co-chaperone GroES [Aerococcus sp. YH-aer221]MCZ0725803.1 co-chaperone GroES [Aerococcus sp. YH-aer222]